MGHTSVLFFVFEGRTGTRSENGREKDNKRKNMKKKQNMKAWKASLKAGNAQSTPILSYLTFVCLYFPEQSIVSGKAKRCCSFWSLKMTMVFSEDR